MSYESGDQHTPGIEALDPQTAAIVDRYVQEAIAERDLRIERLEEALAALTERFHQLGFNLSPDELDIKE